MKKILPFLLLLPLLALADGNDPTTLPTATPVYVTASQATTNCYHAAAAAAAQATATAPACPAQIPFFYVTLIESTYSAIAAPAATLMATTTTNLGTFGASQAMQAAVGENSRQWPFAVPLKTTTAVTATTVVGNAGVAAISQNMKVCGFCAK